jgi:hypothetical protein
MTQRRHSFDYRSFDLDLALSPRYQAILGQGNRKPTPCTATVGWRRRIGRPFAGSKQRQSSALRRGQANPGSRNTLALIRI